METARRANSKLRLAGLPILAAISLLVLPSCGRFESVPPSTTGNDSTPLTAFFVDGQSQPRPTDMYAANQALKEAYLTALKSRLWETMFEVGEGYLKIGEALMARRCYSIALYRARREGSAEGVLRVAEALAALVEPARTSRVDQDGQTVRE